MAAPRVRDTPAATPTGGAVTGAPALRVPQPTSARPRAHHLSGRRARTRQRTPRPAPKESQVRAARKPGHVRTLPEGGPYAGGVGAFDLLQNPLVLRDRAQSLAVLRHLGWKRRRRPGAAPRRPQERAAGGASAARRGGAGRGGAWRGGAQWVGPPRGGNADREGGRMGQPPPPSFLATRP